MRRLRAEIKEMPHGEFRLVNRFYSIGHVTTSVYSTISRGTSLGTSRGTSLGTSRGTSRGTSPSTDQRIPRAACTGR